MTDTEYGLTLSVARGNRLLRKPEIFEGFVRNSLAKSAELGWPYGTLSASVEGRVRRTGGIAPASGIVETVRSEQSEGGVSTVRVSFHGAYSLPGSFSWSLFISNADFGTRLATVLFTVISTAPTTEKEWMRVIRSSGL